MARKIIQISNSVSQEGYDRSAYTTALCDDGTVWGIETFEYGWVKYPDIPQDERKVENDELKRPDPLTTL
ncbi:hypothetical protein [Mannheimia massilioguelmaensis]|uniref:hypothetical protein n=1 Tax=Mannheimia massilioguelmaensis TaxID=1604354 RepID=UPI0005CA70D2|nr:hypothetical protein [Mannheimia massilioguelmaensis]